MIFFDQGKKEKLETIGCQMLMRGEERERTVERMRENILLNIREVKVKNDNMPYNEEKEEL